MRTPQERGYSDQDTRHNLSITASTSLPFGIALAGVLRALSGMPFNVVAGYDLDGDGQSQNDRPLGLPATVGREKVDESLAIINALRATRNLAPITKDMLLPTRYVSLDLRLTKDLNFNRKRVELFLETYNTTNRVNYAGGGNLNISSAALLVRNAARDPRQVQLGARFSF
jgi:hypothetical protein